MNDVTTLPAALSLTESAAQKVRQLLEQQGRDGHVLRVYIQGGGCSGFQYGFNFEELPVPYGRRGRLPRGPRRCAFRRHESQRLYDLRLRRLLLGLTARLSLAASRCRRPPAPRAHAPP